MAISLFVNLTSANRALELQQAPAATSQQSEYESMREAFTGSSTSMVKNSTMSGRQLQILEGMIEGKTNFEIAADLGYSVSTVRQETIKIYQTLNVTGRRAAAQEALRQKIV
jgi:DNA-binding NarL/FixJ family response regulator